MASRCLDIGSLRTGAKEFDYPKGNQNVYTSYAGTGVSTGQLVEALLFAWTQTDVNILFTSYLKPESRIQIWSAFRSACNRSLRSWRLDQDPYGRGERGQTVLDPGRLYRLGSLSYSSPPCGGLEAGLNTFAIP